MKAVKTFHSIRCRNSYVNNPLKFYCSKAKSIIFYHKQIISKHDRHPEVNPITPIAIVGKLRLADKFCVALLAE